MKNSGISEENYGQRDRRGHWKPFEKIEYAPLFVWPIKPVKLIKWIFGFPGYLYPWNIIYF
ncbi:MAG: hypothetical protein OXH47_07460, partial [Paracoccaceae bacterium]|nr:hypothetical protein [Paracoccaceae bacterium]